MAVEIVSRDNELLGFQNWSSFGKIFRTLSGAQYYETMAREYSRLNRPTGWILDFETIHQTGLRIAEAKRSHRVVDWRDMQRLRSFKKLGMDEQNDITSGAARILIDIAGHRFRQSLPSGEWTS